MSDGYNPQAVPGTFWETINYGSSYAGSTFGLPTPTAVGDPSMDIGGVPSINMGEVGQLLMGTAPSQAEAPELSSLMTGAGAGLMGFELLTGLGLASGPAGWIALGAAALVGIGSYVGGYDEREQYEQDLRDFIEDAGVAIGNLDEFVAGMDVAVTRGIDAYSRTAGQVGMQGMATVANQQYAAAVSGVRGGAGGTMGALQADAMTRTGQDLDALYTDMQGTLEGYRTDQRTAVQERGRLQRDLAEAQDTLAEEESGFDDWLVGLFT